MPHAWLRACLAERKADPHFDEGGCVPVSVFSRLSSEVSPLPSMPLTDPSVEVVCPKVLKSLR